MPVLGRCTRIIFPAWGLVALLLASCGGSPSGDSKSTRAVVNPSAAPAPVPTFQAPAPTAAASTCSPLLGHAAYTTQTCESCHPCGAAATSGHPASWTDQTSTGFHAYAANAGLAACQGCHGAALDGVGGSTTTSCAQCHGAAWKTSCVMCHGGTDNQSGAPPRTTWGNSADLVRVGAHTAHVAATHALSPAVACATCHVVPADALSAGHVDGATAEVTFSGPAVLGATTPPSWTRATATCANTYCHGATLQGGTATAPVWTRTDGTQRACTSCHGAPPPAPHSQSTACGGCHTGYGPTTVNVATHLNGVVDVVAMTCTSCHGTPGRAPTAQNPQLAAAPPVDTLGNTATSSRGVGAHMKHLVSATVSSTFACTECHVVPTSTSHANGVKDLAFGTLARTGGKSPTYSATTLGCSATYCHGNFTGGKTTAVPVWTGAAMTCTSCHSMPTTSTGHHSTHMSRSGINCSTCHAGIATGTGSPSTNAVVVGPALHVNGVKDLAFSGTYGGKSVSMTITRSGTRVSCSGSCHSSQTW